MGREGAAVVASVVLSYRRDDAPHAVDRIAERLRERFGADSVFVDLESIAAGEDWRDALQRALQRCDALLVMIGPGWLRRAEGNGPGLTDPDDPVRVEIRTALERGILVVPVLLDGAAMPAPKDLPDDLRGLAARQAFAVDREQFAYDAELLVDRVDSHLDLTASAGRRALAFGVDFLLAASVAEWIAEPFLLLFPAYHWLLVGATGRTVGKLLTGIQVEFPVRGVTRWVYALFRPTAGYLVSILSVVGLVQFVLHRKHQTMHDRLYGTRVLRVHRLASGFSLRLDQLSDAFDGWIQKRLGRMGGAGRLISYLVTISFGVDLFVRGVTAGFGWLAKVVGFSGGAKASATTGAATGGTAASAAGGAATAAGAVGGTTAASVVGLTSAVVSGVVLATASTVVHATWVDDLPIPGPGPRPIEVREVDVRLRVVTGDGLPEPAWLGLAPAGRTEPMHRVSEESTVSLVPGNYDVYRAQYAYDHNGNTTPLKVASDVQIRGGDVAVLEFDTGLRVEAADWVPNPAWWSVRRSGGEERVHWTHSRDHALVLEPGRYDVYWQQYGYHHNGNTTPLKVASDVEIRRGEVPVVRIDTGLRLESADWAPDPHAWSAHRAGTEEPVHWTRSRDHPLILEPGRHDVYWTQYAYDHNGNTTPLKVASDVDVVRGELAVVRFDTGLRLESPEWAPDPDSWSVHRAGTEEPVHWTRSRDHALILEPGRYDVYWTQYHSEVFGNTTPLEVGSDVAVARGEVAEVRFDTGLRLESPEWAPDPYSWSVHRAGTEEPVHWTRSRDHPLIVEPGRYDVYWRQYGSDVYGNTTPLEVGSDVVVARGKVTEVRFDTGLRLESPKWAPDPYSWSVQRAGTEEPVHWTRSRDHPLIVEPGRYDVYWRQYSSDTFGNPRQLRLASGVEVQQSDVAVVNICTGLRVDTAEGVLPECNRWGVARSGETDASHWTRSREHALVVVPGRYDVYWQQRGDDTRVHLASGVQLEDGKLTVLEVKAGPPPGDAVGVHGRVELPDGTVLHTVQR